MVPACTRSLPARPGHGGPPLCSSPATRSAHRRASSCSACSGRRSRSRSSPTKCAARCAPRWARPTGRSDVMKDAQGMTITLTDAERLAARALEHAGTAAAAAASVAKALARAEADGLSSHGLARIPAYCAQVRSGKVDGSAVPRLVPLGPSGARVDAGYGFALPCPGPRDRRGGRARRRDLRCRSGRDQLASLRGRRPPRRAGRRARPDRAHRRQLAGRDRALGRPAGAARHQPDRVRVPAPRGAAACDRRLARQGRARQGDAGGAAAASRFPPTGRSMRKGGRPPMPRPRSPAPCCRWAMPRALRWR